jgi:glutathione peroxidase-family protein
MVWQFGQQESGTADDILAFAQGKQAQFDLFRKVEVNGPNAHPLYKLLLGDDSSCADTDSSCAAWADSGECENNVAFMHDACARSCKLCTPADGGGAPIGWNFESFLVSRAGHVHTRWKTGTDLTAPDQTRLINELLAEKVEL